ncbi:hypothetical protein SAMN05421890_0161 [Ensifer adhaerens]|nr:hypothetical protein SAMN05421890_0161 [Ensifer adhaerens]
MPTKVMMPLALLLGTVIVVAPAAAQVPVNDAARTDTETRTRVCMTRARTFKQASVSPSRGVTVSVTSSHDTAGIAVVSGQSVFGATFSGTTIAGSEFQVIAAVVGSIAAIKTDNVGQVLNSLAAVASRHRCKPVCAEGAINNHRRLLHPAGRIRPEHGHATVGSTGLEPGHRSREHQKHHAQSETARSGRRRKRVFRLHARQELNLKAKQCML